MTIRLKSQGGGNGAGLTIYQTVAIAETAIGTTDDLVYIVEVESIYRYEAAGGAYIRDGTFILNTGNAGTTRWLAVSGGYIYNTASVNQDLTTNAKLTVGGLIDPTGLVLDEQSSVPWGAPGAGKAVIWTRDDVPNIPIFTDDEGTDHVLLGGAGSIVTQNGGIVVDPLASTVNFNNGVTATGGAGTTAVNVDYGGSVSEVGVSGVVGTAVSLSRSDHAHKGLHSITDSVTATPLYGDVTITGGTNVTLTQVGQDISIAAVGGANTQENGTPVDTPASVINFNNGVVATGGAGTTTINTDYGSSASEVGPASIAGSAVSLSRSDHAHKGLHSITDSVTATPLYNDVTITGGTKVSLTQVGQDIQIDASGFVEGPATSTDDALAVYDGTSGDLIKDGVVPIEQYVTAPAGPTSAGIKGQRAYSANYIYECVATNVWIRCAAISTW